MKVVQHSVSLGKKFNEPWMTRSGISACGDMSIFQGALGVAKSSRRRKFADLAVTATFWPK